MGLLEKILTDVLPRLEFHENHRKILLRITIFLLAVGLSFAFLPDMAEKAFVLWARDVTTSPAEPTPSERSFRNQAASFFDHLERLPPSRYTAIFGEYQGALDKEMDMERLYFPSYGQLETLMDSAVENSIDVLTLFTLPMLQHTHSKALVLDSELLIRLDRQYNLHALFLISAACVDNDSHAQMQFLITGQGKLIVGYNGNMTIEHPDFPFATGRYEYRELFVMDARTDERGNVGLFHIKGLSSPTGDYEWMKGPLNSKIRSLSLTSDRGNEKKILVRYDLWGTREKVIDRIPIENVTE
jgi:hypothetical protein